MTLLRTLARAAFMLSLLSGIGVVTAAGVGRIQPPGTIVVFADENFCSNGIGISAINTDVQTRGVGQPFVVVPGNCMSFTEDFDCSPDGRHITFFSNQNETQIGIYITDTYHQFHRFTHPNQGIPRWVYQGAAYYLEWSPDGQLIAFVATETTRNQTEYTLVVLNVFSGSAEELVHSTASIKSPSWSPDGHYIAYAEGTAITVVNLQGDPVHTLEIGTSIVFLEWSPTSDILLVGLYNNGRIVDLYTVDIEQEIRISIPIINVIYASWSPDGNRLAYSRAQNSPTSQLRDLLIVNSDGSNEQYLLRDHDDLYNICWLT